MSLLRKPKVLSPKVYGKEKIIKLYSPLKNWKILYNYEVSIKIGFLKYAVLKSNGHWSDLVDIKIRDKNIFSQNYIRDVISCELPFAAKSRCRIFDDSYHDKWTEFNYISYNP